MMKVCFILNTGVINLIICSTADRYLGADKTLCIYRNAMFIPSTVINDYALINLSLKLTNNSSEGNFLIG